MPPSSSRPVAIITGAASGMGLALSKHLLSHPTHPYRVVMTDVNARIGQEHASSLRDASGDNVLFVQCDVSDYAQQQRLFARAFHWGGNRVDFLAANAGIGDQQLLYETNETVKTEKVKIPVADGQQQEIEVEAPVKMNVKTMEVDLDAVLQGVWLFKWYNRRSQIGEGEKKGGVVVATSSAAGLYPSDFNPQYGAAKHGIVGLVRSAGPTLLKDDSITLNCICPTLVMTGLAPPIFKEIFPKEHITPMSTILRAFDTFIENKATMTGQTVECTVEELYFRQPPEPSNKTQRWLMEESGPLWEKAKDWHKEMAKVASQS